MFEQEIKPKYISFKGGSLIWIRPYSLKMGGYMQSLTLGEIAKATNGKILNGSEDLIINGVNTDSRLIKQGELFIPLIDARDGHDFIDSAIKNGASALITQKDIINNSVGVIKVDNTTLALGRIARFYKKKHNVKTVAITGSVGKTTTKDIVHSALNANINTLKTQKNFNNHIGVPYTVFSIEQEHKAAVIEMGMNHFDELNYLASIVEPDIAVITNIGMSHIENLGSREGIFKAKMEITNHFGKNNILIVNGDDEYLKTLKGKTEFKVITYGIDNENNDIKAYNIKSLGLFGMSFMTRVGGREYKVTVNIPGYHNVYNALCAIAVAREFGVDLEKAIDGISRTVLTENRFEVEEYDGKTLLKDYYNASADSIKAALSVMSEAKDKRLVAVLGDILELGDYAKKTHYDLGKAVCEAGIELLVTAGANAKEIANGAKAFGLENVVSFDTTEEAALYVKENIKCNDAVLIKASHGMHFEKIYDKIKE